MMRPVHSKSANSQVQQDPFSLVDVDQPLIAGSILPVEASKPVDGSGQPSLLPHRVCSAPALPNKPHSVSYASTVVKEEGAASSEPIGDQIFRAGVAVVSMLSDLAISKLPTSDDLQLVKLEIIAAATFEGLRKLDSLKDSNKSRCRIGIITHLVARGQACCKDTTLIQIMPSDYIEVAASGSALTTSRQYCNTKELENVSSILKTFSKQVLKKMNDYGSALGFFYWLKRQPKFKHDEHTYTTMFGNLGRAKQFRVINKLLDEMVRDGCRPNTVTYNRLIHSYGRANYLNEAMNVFNQMQEAGCKPDRVTYCTLIDIHAKAGFLNIAMDMHQRIEAACISTDTFTYSVIINCLGKAGHLPAAHKLFCELIDQGCTPNLVTYNIMIDLHAKARNYQSALKLYRRDMQNAGFKPDKVTYSIVMEVLGHCGYLEEAEAVFTEMQLNNWIPDEPVYGILVDLWGKAGNVEKAWVNKIAEAYELLQNMLALGLRPSLQTYTLLLSCCTDGRSKLDMVYCNQLMASTGHPAHMFLLKMPSAGPDGQNVRNHVNSFLDLMHSEDRESKRGMMDAVVNFLHKSGQKEEAGSVWEVTAQKNVFPDALREKSSSYWLINLHVMSEGTAVTALSRTLAWFRQQMLVSGSCPFRIDIVTGWRRRSRVTGTSMVRQAVEELLNMFGSPFFTESGNSGCFVGCGEPLNRWLLQSYVERMHLL
ncbi:hypothetical protein Bca52824_031913 [Brassica carinata]|uniref:Smr domain-containing protein n=1 Tax=Brassica carinata TaxID=52824 RepID=A0A8X7SBJ3_BRACI|nr:hypothetical protein Bca52824_031913 [Brassica carinata]